MLNTLRELILFTFVLGLLLAGTSVSGQSTEREIIVSVLDGNGVPAVGLTSSDFSVQEDGVTREILRVHQNTGMRHIALLIDTSSSTAQSIGDFRRAAKVFVEGMNDGNSLSIIGFGNRPQILAESTSDLEKLQAGIDSLFSLPQSASYVIDAVSEVAKGFERIEAQRPVIVVVMTLGLDYSNRDARPTINQLKEVGAAMYAIVLNDRQRASGSRSALSRQKLQFQIHERDYLLDQGPKLSGGRRRDLQTSMGIVRAMKEIVNNLRNQYVVVYSRPDALIPPTSIEVSVPQKHLDARGTPILVGE